MSGVKKLEEEWSNENEEYLCGIIRDCNIRSDQHERAGYLFKSKNTYWGLPLVLLPTIMSPISILMEHNEELSKYINAFAFLTTGVIGGVYSFFKFGEKMSEHFNMSSRYSDVRTDIELELTKKREFRMQLDVFITRIHMITDNLANIELTLPRNILDDKKYKNIPTGYVKVPLEELDKIDILVS
jgi:hypothetical protein